jgi:hypothetical protein
MALCAKCGNHKNDSDFYYFKGNRKSPCKDCKKTYQSLYYKNNLEKIETYRQNYYFDNKKILIENQKKRSESRKDQISLYQREYRKNNNKKYKQYRKNRKSNIFYKFRNLISNAIYQALKINKSTKNNISCFKYLNYSVQDLKFHLESKFEPWMNWENHGSYNYQSWDDNNPLTWTWNIDHIIPQSLLPFSSMNDENFKKCWSLNNLRPLSSKKNILDGNRR